MKIKSLIERIQTEKMGLTVSCHSLDLLIHETLNIVGQCDPQHENYTFHPTQTAVRVVMLWSGNIWDWNFDKFDEIQKFLNMPLLKRLIA